MSTASSSRGATALGVIGGKSLCDVSKMLVTSCGRIGVIEPRDDVTMLGDVGGDEVSCNGGNESWTCARTR